MEVTKLSDFLKQQGDTPQGKSVYQAFIDNFDKDYDAESFRKDEKGSIAAAFQWDICPEDLEFWDIVDNKWQEVTDPENDMLWLLDGKEPPKETDEELSEQKEYPRWFKFIDSELVVQFNSLYDGVVVISDDGYSVGDEDSYIAHADTSVWQEVPNLELAQEQNKILDEANSIDGKRKQIGGNHYAKHTIQPWDIIREYELDYFEGNALKYLLRQKDNRLEDLQKAAHYLEECIKNEQKRIENE